MARERTEVQTKAGSRSAGAPCTRRHVLRRGLDLGAALGVGAPAIVRRAAAAPFTLRFGSDSPLAAPHTKSALVFKNLVESRTSGRIEVRIFPDGQLGGNGPMTNSVKAGSLEAVVVDVGHISVAVPEADVFNLPFLYRGTEQVLRFANGPIGERLKPRINEAFNCEVLGWASDGSANLFNGKHAIRTPADVVGLKLGANASKTLRDAILALGATPTVLEITAMYTSLQTGLIDGTQMNLTDMIALKLYQVTKYLTVTNHYSMPTMLIVSKKFLDRLSPEDQAIVREAGKPAVDAQVEGILAAEKTELAFLQERGIQVFAPESIKAFSDKMEMVYKNAADRIGTDLVNEARRFAESS
jgi:tripartite ATP-independent transporter DctP family solute receptor